MNLGLTIPCNDIAQGSNSDATHNPIDINIEKYKSIRNTSALMLGVAIALNHSTLTRLDSLDDEKIKFIEHFFDCKGHLRQYLDSESPDNSKRTNFKLTLKIHNEEKINIESTSDLTESFGNFIKSNLNLNWQYVLVMIAYEFYKNPLLFLCFLPLIYCQFLYQNSLNHAKELSENFDSTFKNTTQSIHKTPFSINPFNEDNQEILLSEKEVEEYFKQLFIRTNDKSKNQFKTIHSCDEERNSNHPTNPENKSISKPDEPVKTFEKKSHIKQTAPQKKPKRKQNNLMSETPKQKTKKLESHETQKN